MSNLLELRRESDVKEVLEHFVSCHENIEGVIVITLNKDGTQFLRASSMSMMQKSFLKAFFDSYILRWFYHIED